MRAAFTQNQYRRPQHRSGLLCQAKYPVPENVSISEANVRQLAMGSGYDFNCFVLFLTLISITYEAEHNVAFSISDGYRKDFWAGV
jgi:hypothetical protein